MTCMSKKPRRRSEAWEDLGNRTERNLAAEDDFFPGPASGTRPSREMMREKPLGPGEWVNRPQAKANLRKAFEEGYWLCSCGNVKDRDEDGPDGPRGRTCDRCGSRMEWNAPAAQ